MGDLLALPELWLVAKRQEKGHPARTCLPVTAAELATGTRATWEAIARRERPSAPCHSSPEIPLA